MRKNIRTFKVELPEDEIGFITLHIVNAEMDNENLKQTMEVTKLMQEISNIVRYYFSVEFNTESVYYYRFITHLKNFSIQFGKSTALLISVWKKSQSLYRVNMKRNFQMKKNYI